jgi:hypothetical protein
MMELSGVEQEVAEERAEVAEEECERLKNRVGEMESELCVLRGEMERLDKGGLLENMARMAMLLRVGKREGT